MHERVVQSKSAFGDSLRLNKVFDHGMKLFRGHTLRLKVGSNPKFMLGSRRSTHLFVVRGAPVTGVNPKRDVGQVTDLLQRPGQVPGSAGVNGLPGTKLPTALAEELIHPKVARIAVVHVYAIQNE